MNSTRSDQNEVTKKLIEKVRAGAQAEVRDCSFERSLYNDYLKYEA